MMENILITSMVSSFFSTAFIAVKQTGCAVLQLDQTLGLHLKNWAPSILLAVLAPKTAPDSATSFRIGFVQTGQCMPQVLPQDQANPITNAQCFKILARNFVEGDRQLQVKVSNDLVQIMLQVMETATSQSAYPIFGQQVHSLTVTQSCHICYDALCSSDRVCARSLRQ